MENFGKAKAQIIMVNALKMAKVVLSEADIKWVTNNQSVAPVLVAKELIELAGASYFLNDEK